MARGDVLLISLPISDGREQSVKRPAIALQTDVAGEPMLMIAPKLPAFLLLASHFQ
jgi:mRNA interferase MazF